MFSTQPVKNLLTHLQHRTLTDTLTRILGCTVLFAACNAQAGARAPLPQFPDPQLQACFQEQVVAQGWQWAEDVDQLICPDRGIAAAFGLDQLPNLVKLDLSDNPLADLGSLAGLEHTLREVILSGATLSNLYELERLHRLVRLLLNDTQITDPSLDNYQIEQSLNRIVGNNQGLAWLGLNGFRISDPVTLFQSLPRTLASLALSRTGLQTLPVPLVEFRQLQALDLSGNPLVDLGPLYELADTLQVLNLSDTTLDYLPDLLPLRALRQLRLNDIDWSGPPEDPVQQEWVLQQVLANNPKLTAVGFNGFQLSDPLTLFRDLSRDLVSLELSRANLHTLPVPLAEFSRLQVLDLSGNPIGDLGPLHGLEETLQVLDLSDTTLRHWPDLQGLRALRQLRLNSIDLDDPFVNPQQLEQHLHQVLINNPALHTVGFNGVPISDVVTLFNHLPRGLVSLELSRTWLNGAPGPLPLAQFTHLQVLDLSGNTLIQWGPLTALGQTLQVLDLSDTRVDQWPALTDLTALRRLRLNDMQLQDPLIDPLQLEQQLNQVLNANVHLIEVGFNGFTISDPVMLFQSLPRHLESLALSRTGLQTLPVPLVEFRQLQALDLSGNPLVDLGPLYELADTLQVLNLSDTTLDYLPDLLPLRALRQLRLNDIDWSGPPEDPVQQEWVLQQVLANNPKLTAVGFNGFQLSDPLTLFRDLSRDLVSLELSRANLHTLPVPLAEFSRLQVLDLSGNPIGDLGPLHGLEETLQVLDLSDTTLRHWPDLQGLRALRQLRLNSIDLDDPFVNPQQLEQHLHQVLINNPALHTVGFNGVPISDVVTLFNHLPRGLVSLELSRTWLNGAPGPLPLAQFTHLQVLDLSGNTLIQWGPLTALGQTLQVLDLSDTRVGQWPALTDLTALRRLRLNDMQLQDPLIDPLQLEQQLNQVLSANVHLIEVGFNGFTISDPVTLFQSLPRHLESLALSRTGLRSLPVPLMEFRQLQALDLSGNPLVDLGPLYELADTLQVLNLSDTTLDYLPDLLPLRTLRQLRLNDIDWSGAPEDPVQQEWVLQQVLANNPKLTAVGFNGFQLSDPLTLFSYLSPNLVSLELGNTGLQAIPVPLDQFSRLHTLDLSVNPLTAIGPLQGLAYTLKRLDLSQTRVHSLFELRELRALTALNLNQGQTPVDDLWLLNEILRHNPALQRVGLSDIQLSANIDVLVQTLSELPLTWLDIANTGSGDINWSMPLVENLHYLNASDNGMTTTTGLIAARQLEQLYLDNNQLVNISDLLSIAQSEEIRLISLSGNDNLACVDLDALASSLPPGVELIRPANCQ
ncbi:hypothetical protein FKG94_10905 [Exilibacterium tricleocarpae]|uniref:Leucine-rich repeat domain-containing protein n=1 Tax=Exilibacterium tricleocarpae TaxID=2591008 RepID=A0A545TSH4_9GAMM|nr:hypothetical protein [Exilibacterium tricleocarpae]TQV80167.1 hypothetical protein FKG94_10905 [Exilibacterium tricleocarpae]